MSSELNLSENQIYKWFWDTKKKVDDDNNTSLQIGTKLSVCAGVFGSKLVSGSDGQGVSLTPQQIKQALKINAIAAERETEFERIANSLNLDIEQLAQDIIAMPSPTGYR